VVERSDNTGFAYLKKLLDPGQSARISGRVVARAPQTSATGCDAYGNISIKIYRSP
jgi:hypothetical protein